MARASTAAVKPDGKKVDLMRERAAEVRRPPAAPPLSPNPPRRRVVYYPTGDGKPVAETDKHITVLAQTRDGLRLHYKSRADSVYVSGNNFLYYEEGNPKARISPDGYVVFGVPQRERDSYKVWEEGGRLPAIVFEFTSKKTQAEDMKDKFRLYEQVLKIPEYVLFDPTGDFLEPRLRGYRLVEGRYVPIEWIEGRLYSEQLNLYLVIDGVQLRFYDPVSERYLPTLERADAQRQEAEERRQEAEAREIKAEERRQEAEARAAVETQARAASEAESARLRAEIAALRRALKEGGVNRSE